MSLQLTPKTTVRFAIALSFFSAGMHYLVSGRKEANMGKMFTGAFLALGSLFFL